MQTNDSFHKLPRAEQCVVYVQSKIEEIVGHAFPYKVLPTAIAQIDQALAGGLEFTTEEKLSAFWTIVVGYEAMIRKQIHEQGLDLE